MVAALGFLVQENFHPIFPDVGGPGARLLFGVMLTEIQRAKTGWMDPDEAMQELRPEYTPGDLGFDPLGMAPKTDADMLAMKNKELNNGRLAMMAVAGIVAQEWRGNRIIFTFALCAFGSCIGTSASTCA